MYIEILRVQFIKSVVVTHEWVTLHIIFRIIIIIRNGIIIKGISMIESGIKALPVSLPYYVLHE